jgi:pentapeptide MXKDX repeat protein
MRTERPRVLTENDTFKGEIVMISKTKLLLATAALVFTFGLHAPAYAQDTMKQQDNMKHEDGMQQQDGMQHDSMQQDSMKHEGMPQEKGKTLETGTFHGRVHNTSGRATIYREESGKLILRLTNFKTSNGPDVHVILIAAKDADDDANFLKSNTKRVELGKLKGNEGDQNYDIPGGTDLSKFQTVSIYCERFNANFGAAALEKF